MDFFLHILYYMKYLKLVRYITSIALLISFIFVCSIMYSTELQYVFNYHNDKVIYSGNKNNNNISLMFNVYWGTEYIDDILSICNKYDIKATFFLGGSWAEGNLDKVLNIYLEGHEIGNHGYLHKDHSVLDYDLNAQEINATNNLIKEYIGIDMNLFAPPSGEFNDATIMSCDNLNYNIIMWSRDTIDWRDQDSNVIYNRAINNLNNGDLILMHPTKATVKALPMIITYILANDFNLTTVSNNVFS